MTDLMKTIQSMMDYNGKFPTVSMIRCWAEAIDFPATKISDYVVRLLENEHDLSADGECPDDCYICTGKHIAVNNQILTDNPYQPAMGTALSDFNKGNHLYKERWVEDLFEPQISLSLLEEKNTGMCQCDGCTSISDEPHTGLYCGKEVTVVTGKGTPVLRWVYTAHEVRVLSKVSIGNRIKEIK